MSRVPVVASPSTTLGDALRLMEALGLRRLPVVDRGRLLGIPTDVEIHEWMGLASRDSIGVPLAPAGGRIGDRVAPPPAVLGPCDTIDHAAALLYVHRIGALGVTAGQRLIGILTTSDVLRAMVAAVGTEDVGTIELGLAGDVGAPIWARVRGLADRGLAPRALLHVPRADGTQARRLVVTRTTPG